MVRSFPLSKTLSISQIRGFMHPVSLETKEHALLKIWFVDRKRFGA